MTTRSKTSIASATFAALVFVVSSSACNSTKKVTKDDCDRWAVHLGEIMGDEADARTKTCKDGVGLGMSLVALMLGDADGRKEFSKDCNKSDATYKTKDDSCFMAAKTLKDARACGFNPPFKDDKGDFKTMLARFDEENGKKCQADLSDDSSSSGDDKKKKPAADDDDDKPKKKKKKKSSDDDDQ